MWLGFGCSMVGFGLKFLGFVVGACMVALIRENDPRIEKVDSGRLLE